MIAPAVRCSPLALLALGGCAPTLEMSEGAERQRLVEIVRQFCAAERSPDRNDTRPLLVASLAEMAGRVPPGPDGAHLTSVDPGRGCQPGKAWYLGGSRMFAEVRLDGQSDRLDFWRSHFPKIGDVHYGRRRYVAGRKVASARAAFLALSPAQAQLTPAPPSVPCEPEPYHFAFLATGTAIDRQGATVKIKAMGDMSPAGSRELEAGCVGGWTISGPASLAADRTSFTIAPDAPVGSVVRVGFTHSGKPVAAEYRVIGRDEIVLTGRYSQQGLTGCQVGEIVRELEFGPGGRFSVTFNPFESYRDYWGSYSFDPVGGRIALKVEGGNFVPPGLDLEGQAELVAGRLILKNVFLGSRDMTPWKDCTYTFQQA